MPDATADFPVGPSPSTARVRIRAFVEAYRRDPLYARYADRLPMFVVNGKPLYLRDLLTLVGEGDVDEPTEVPDDAPIVGGHAVVPGVPTIDQALGGSDDELRQLHDPQGGSEQVPW